MSEREKESEKGMMKKEADDSELSGVTTEGDSDDIAWGFEIRKNELVAKLMELTGEIDESDVPPPLEDFVKAFEAEVARNERDIAKCEEVLMRTDATGPIEKYRISTRTLVVLLLLLVGAYVGIDFVYREKDKREKAACELFQKGQPLPDSPYDIQLPNVDSLYELVDECETTHGVDVTYGCAAEGVLHTAVLNHEPSEISEDIKAEALRVAEEVKCNQ